MTAAAVWFYVELVSTKLMSIDWKRNENMQMLDNYSRVIRNSTMSRRINFRLFPQALCRILVGATVAGSLALLPSAVEGQDGAAVSVSVTAPGPNPASLGSNVTVSATGSPTAPSRSQLRDNNHKHELVLEQYARWDRYERRHGPSLMDNPGDKLWRQQRHNFGYGVVLWHELRQ
jgi:hypothetical protein